MANTASKSGVELRLEKTLTDWHKWNVSLSAKPKVVRQFTLGRSHNTYLVEHKAFRFVVRINNPCAALLGTDITREISILKALHDCDFAPRLYYHHHETNALVMEYFEGQTCEQSDIGHPDFQEKMESLITRYQNISICLPPFNYTEHITRYWQALSDKHTFKGKHRKEWEKFLPLWQGYESKIVERKLVHHDLNPSNIIKTADGLRIIDWEYAGLGIPNFDRRYLDHLSNISQIEKNEDMLPTLFFWLDGLWEALQEST